MDMRKFVSSVPTAWLVCALLVAGCSRQHEPAAEADSYPIPPDAKVSECEPGVRGGQFVLATFADPKTFNLMVANETSSTDVAGLLFSGLTTTSPLTQQVEPSLAKSWEHSDDYLTWTFHLREGVRWSDGEPLTADDVIFSFQVLYDPDIRVPMADLLQVDGKPFEVEKVDEYTVRFHLPGPYAPFENFIGGATILPEHKLREAYESGNFESAWGVGTPPDEIVGTGPYVLDRFLPGEKVVLRRNPHYWVVDSQGERLPYLDRIVFINVPDLNSMLLAFQSGQTDALESVRPEDYDRLLAGAEKGGYTVADLGPSLGSEHLWFNQNPGVDEEGKPYVDPVKLRWFTDVRFRRAVAHAIDRDTIVKNVLHGRGSPAWGPVSPANKFWYNPDVARYPYDLKLAGSILDEAGYKDRDGDGVREDSDGNPIRFTLITNTGNDVRIAIGNIIRRDLQDLGMDVTFAPMEFNAIVTKLASTYDYECCLLGLTGGLDPAGGMNVWLSSGATHEWYPRQKEPATEWEARIDELMFAQIKEMDRNKRKALFDEVQLIVSRQLPFIYTVTADAIVAYRNKFANIKPAVIRPRIMWNIDEVYLRPRAASGEKKG